MPARYCAGVAPTLGAEVGHDLPLLVATQLLRTRLQRTTMEELASQLRDLTTPWASTVPALTDAANRLQHFQYLLDIQAVADLVASKDFLLLVCSDAARPQFFISDNPVVLHNSFPYGRIGLDAPGIEIRLPSRRRRKGRRPGPPLHSLLRAAHKERGSCRTSLGLRAAPPRAFIDSCAA